MWWIVGGLALVAIVVVALVRARLVRRSGKPAWDSLTREEQGILMRNSQPGTYGGHESAKATGSAGPNSSRMSPP